MQHGPTQQRSSGKGHQGQEQLSECCPAHGGREKSYPGDQAHRQRCANYPGQCAHRSQWWLRVDPGSWCRATALPRSAGRHRRRSCHAIPAGGIIGAWTQSALPDCLIATRCTERHIAWRHAWGAGFRGSGPRSTPPPRGPMVAGLAAASGTGFHASGPRSGPAHGTPCTEVVHGCIGPVHGPQEARPAPLTPSMPAPRQPPRCELVHCAPPTAISSSTGRQMGLQRNRLYGNIL